MAHAAPKATWMQLFQAVDIPTDRVRCLSDTKASKLLLLPWRELQEAHLLLSQPRLLPKNQVTQSDCSIQTHVFVTLPRCTRQHQVQQSHCLHSCLTRSCARPGIMRSGISPGIMPGQESCLQTSLQRLNHCCSLCGELCGLWHPRDATLVHPEPQWCIR